MIYWQNSTCNSCAEEKKKMGGYGERLCHEKLGFWYVLQQRANLLTTYHMWAGHRWWGIQVC